MFKRLEKDVFHRLRDKGRSTSYTLMIQGIDHTTVAIETLKVATRVLAQEKHSLLLKNFITKEHPYEGRKHCRKAKVAPEDIRNQSQRGKNRVLRTTCFNHGKFKPPSPMKTSVEKRNSSKSCEFHGEVAHTTNECMDLKREIEKMLKLGKLSYLIKKLKQSNRKDHEKATKGGNLRKRKTAGNINGTIMAKGSQKKITQTFSPKLIIYFPPLEEEDGTEGPMIIEGKIGGHFVYHMYVKGGSSSKILYEHCCNRFRREVRNQMVPATTLLVAFSGEIIGPLGQISLLVKIGDEEHSTYRMCVDFKDLNKTFPKEGYPLLEIDWKKNMRKRQHSSQAKEYSVTKNAEATYQRLAFSLPGESSHWQYKFPLPVNVVPTARRLEMPLPGVWTAIEEIMKKPPVKDRWQLH
nr:reverse transcriptase domain-containing protein [Tanacetum cinerariifolium]